VTAAQTQVELGTGVWKDLIRGFLREIRNNTDRKIGKDDQTENSTTIS